MTIFVTSTIKLIKVPLNLDKEIYLLHIFEDNNEMKKRYLKNDLILVEKEILTSSFSDTIHFIEELRLFDVGNDQNKFLNITEYKKTKNLKLNLLDKEKNIFISKSEAKSMCKIFDFAMRGYSLNTLLEDEYKFTPELLSELLHENKILERK